MSPAFFPVGPAVATAASTGATTATGASDAASAESSVFFGQPATTTRHAHRRSFRMRPGISQNGETPPRPLGPRRRTPRFSGAGRAAGARGGVRDRGRLGGFPARRLEPFDERAEHVVFEVQDF